MIKKQLSDKDENTQKPLNEEEIGNLPEKEFRVIIVKMIKDIRKILEAQIERLQEMYNKELEDLKNKHTKMNSTRSKIKNTLEGINSRIMEVEEQVSEVEDSGEITATEKNKEKIMKRINSLGVLWDNIKHKNFHIIGVPEEKRGPEEIFEEIIAENFPNMEKEALTKVEEAQRIPYRINTRKNSKKHTHQTEKKFQPQGESNK